MATSLRTAALESLDWWVAKLNRRLVLLGAYIGFQLAICVVFGLLFGEARTAFLPLWTFWQGESSYIDWQRIFHLHPLTGYLPILLIVGTIHLTSLWFIVFRGDGPLLDLPFFRWLFNAGRHPRFRDILEKKKSRIALFQVGLIPDIWFVGFMYLRQHPMKYGLATMLVANGTKLTLWSVFMALGLGKGWLWITIAAFILFSFFIPRFVERLLPGNGRNSALRSP